jgi:hypothetical protein
VDPRRGERPLARTVAARPVAAHVSVSLASHGSTPPIQFRTCPRGDDGPL